MRKESGSSLATFLDCPKKYYYRYEKLLDSRGYSSSLGLGSLVHAFIEQWTGKGNPAAVAEQFKQIKDRCDPESWPYVEIDLRKALGMSNSWESYWKSPSHPFGNDKWEWIHSELEFSFPVNPDGDSHVGKMDGVIRHKEWNKVFVYELKTATAREKDSYIHRLGVDRQVFANIYAAKEMGFHVDGILYDIIWKPMIRQKKEETVDQLADRFVATINADPSLHFQREVLYRKEGDINDHLYDVQAQFEALHNARKEGGRFYRNSGACDNFGKLCPYFSVCLEGGVELESAYRIRDRKLPELSKEIQE